MNYEMIMLNGAKHLKNLEEDYRAEARRIAISSFSDSGSTMSQMENVMRVSQIADACGSCYSLVMSALKNTPRPYRALLTEVYLKRTDKNYLCKLYNVSPSRLYRALAKARMEYSKCLRALNCDEQWFFDNFGMFDWIKRMAVYEPGKGGKLSLA